MVQVEVSDDRIFYSDVNNLMEYRMRWHWPLKDTFSIGL